MRVLGAARNEPCGCGVDAPVDIQRNPWSFYCRRHGTPLRRALVKEDSNIDLWQLGQLLVQRVFGPDYGTDRAALITGTADELRPVYHMLSRFSPGTAVELHGAFLWYRDEEAAGVERLPK